METPPHPEGSATEVLLAFLRLGCLSFGGPIAHLGYLHTEFVERRRWCSEEAFAELVAIAQSLPGPASSQVVFALGLVRARFAGAFAAWAAFTLPSALLMLAFALGHPLLIGRTGSGILHGLQIVAVAIVAQAVFTMQRSLAPDAPRLAIALLAAATALIAPTAIATLAAILFGAILGAAFLPRIQNADQFHLPFTISRCMGFIAATLFFLLLLLPFAATGSRTLAVFSAFYRTGALVFGGGHVVLPLLEQAVVAPGWVDQTVFLAGYGATQAVPGPLFTFAAFLGASIRPSPSPLLLSALSLVAIFLPGLLLMVAVLPFWSTLRENARLQSSLRGVNASVVGVLFAAFLHPVITTALHSVADIVLAVAALLALIRFKLAPWIVVLVSVLLATIGTIIHH